MKLYREVKARGDKGCYFRGIYIEPIEITEEEIEEILTKFTHITSDGWVVISAIRFEEISEAILSKLKGE